ncbi:S8 family serine peptidase [Aquimarina sp. AU119]|uniref:S8 family serine peptidase n=1 Tax=Aquimarina sp. AU119 TaxID=2108528 RepID=UPI001F2041E4|nr:S8 family serine peptidase [Aquimarina sp. AU119]
MKKSYKSLNTSLSFMGKVTPAMSTFAFMTMVLLSSGLFAQNAKQKQQIAQETNLAKLSQLQIESSNKATLQKKEALQAAKSNGWQVKMTNADGSFSELQRIAKDGSPLYYTTFNVDAAKSTRTNHLNSGGSLGLNLDGQNMTAHVWDGGHARASHQEYDGAGGSNRVTIRDIAGEGGLKLNFHAAHVTGTIAASGVQANAKGMAPHTKIDGYMWNNDVAEATAAAANGMLVSNHSYGFRGDLVPDQYFGAYIDESRNWDEVMHNAPFYLMVVAAGNDGNRDTYNAAPLDGNSSYDKLTGHSTSKNNLVVANAQDANVNSSGTLVSVSINSSSSEGPTDDYRIKPDITGNGTGVYSTYESSDTAYNSITGTSMASPNVAGSLLLLQQHYNNVNGNFMKAATLKGLALHTADDAGPSGPDAVYGWGLLNAKKAAETITDNGSETKVEELTLTSGQTYTITVDSDGTSPLMASISWTDVPGAAVTATNSNTAVLVNDLDIRVSKGGTTYNPYRLTGITTNGTGDNTVDPYERIDVANASGTYTITVTNKGSLTGGSQNFSLIVTGLTGTPVVCSATVPAGVNNSNVGNTSATIGWTAVPGATYDVRYRQTGTTSWTTQTASATSYAISGLSASTSYEAQVRSKCSDGTTSSYSASTTFTTTAVQLNYCASNGNSVADEYISNVQLGTINNASSAGSGGYTDFTSISTTVAKGSSNTISVTPTWTGTQYNEGYSVWIDYNQDGDFADSGEQVWTQAATQTTPVSGTFTVPASAADGSTRMRVSMKYNGIPTSCESFQYGEVEDYTIIIGTSTGGGGGNTGCTSGISSFPYNEGFENTLGAWTQSSADDINWTVDASGTPSRGTGPSSATQGSYYIFVEASGNGTGYPNKQAILNSPCFDLSGLTSASFTFSYHMYGAADMGSIAVEASNDNGATWTSLWNQTGNKGNSWQTANIDLASYVGNSVQLRFNRVTGATWQADIAIDNVALSSGSSTTSIFAVTADTLGQEVSELSTKITAYPNPLAPGDVLNIASQNSEAKPYTIYNTLGQVVGQGKVTNTINVDGLEAGLYMLKVNTTIINIVKQ